LPFGLNVKEVNNYYPFGMMEPGLCFNSEDYRFGFNGMEKDDEIKGVGNSYTTDYRMNDPRIGGRWLSLDPIVKPWESPYAGYGNNPIVFVDPEGSYEINSIKDVQPFSREANRTYIYVDDYLKNIFLTNLNKNTGSPAQNLELWKAYKDGFKKLKDFANTEKKTGNEVIWSINEGNTNKFKHELFGDKLVSIDEAIAESGEAINIWTGIKQNNKISALEVASPIISLGVGILNLESIQGVYCIDQSIGGFYNLFLKSNGWASPGESYTTGGQLESYLLGSNYGIYDTGIGLALTFMGGSKTIDNLTSESKFRRIQGGLDILDTYINLKNVQEVKIPHKRKD